MPSYALPRGMRVTTLAALALLVAGLPASEAARAQDVLTVGAVQGPVVDSDDGSEHGSPYEGQEVLVRGVVTQKTQSRTSSGGTNHGFFLQSSVAGADGEPQTSDGIFVFHGRFETLRRDGGGFYEPQIGDQVVLRDEVEEFFGLTELGNPFLVEVEQTGLQVGTDTDVFETDPPDDLADAERYWERREGMQARVPAGSVVLSGRNVFSSTLDGEVWVARGDSQIAQRDDPYARRAFRDAHPLDNHPDQLFDDGNGYRIMMGSLGIKATADDAAALIAPARTFDTMTNTPVGGVYFAFGKYSVQVAGQPAFAHGVDPSANQPPTAFNRKTAYSTAVYNVENLYDFRDDPNDGCDFAGNDGCPGVFPPFDYVPASQAAYQARLADLAAQIAGDLHAPDVLLIQEAEDQDICSVEDSTPVCGTEDGADGKPDTLQDLALVLADTYGVDYDAVADRDGADDRGIISALMYRTDRIELLEAAPDDPVLGSNPQVAYRSSGLAYNTDVSNPKALNAVLPDDIDPDSADACDEPVPCVFTRDPQVAKLRVWKVAVGRGPSAEVWAVSNHFSSGPDRRVEQRTEQAAYNAAIIDAIRDDDPDAYGIVGGDLNVFPRPDDPFPPDEGGASDQLGPLYEAGLTNLFDVLVDEVPVSAYSYTFEGQAQTLDQLFVTGSLVDELEQVRATHINADFPAEFDGDGSRGASDHDPVLARFTAPLPDPAHHGPR